MYGIGLFKGLRLTLKKFFSKKITQEYPEQKPVIDDRWRGSFQYITSECIMCGICVRECPNNAIIMDVSKDENNKRTLETFSINFERCLVCGFCVEACPKACLLFTKEYEKTVYHRSNVYLDLLADENLDAPGSSYAQKENQPEKEGE